jgi:hypothetical protein
VWRTRLDFDSSQTISVQREFDWRRASAGLTQRHLRTVMSASEQRKQ